ncbi:MAG TPA: type II toxin-antitoxin system VapC family toxin [Planctomycetota bacterium]|nr:type II toxin-antitoxin system VapC family toxin [Planctomycetota bacterium]
MRLYMDSSAFAKRYIQEPGTARVRALLELADELLLSVLTLPEVAGALNRLRREGRLTDAGYSGCKQRLLADLEGASVVAITPAILSGAVRCLERVSLRAADAVHVAAALEANPDQFVSADHRQCKAARAMGLVVVDVSSEAEGG